MSWKLYLHYNFADSLQHKGNKVSGRPFLTVRVKINPLFCSVNVVLTDNLFRVKIKQNPMTLRQIYVKFKNQQFAHCVSRKFAKTKDTLWEKIFN